MRVDMVPADFNKYGFDIVFRMTEKASGREVARGKLGVVFVHPGDKKVAVVPPRFLERIAAL
jgi:acyl-CoA thioesterase FadM